MKKCPKCQEESEDQFDSCWKCGTYFGNRSDLPSLEDGTVIPEKLPEERSTGRYWLYSVLVPLGLWAGGILVGLGLVQFPRGSDDWLGAHFLIPYFIGTILASIAALGFAAASIFKAEKYASVALLSGLIALGYLACVVMAISEGSK